MIGRTEEEITIKFWKHMDDGNWLSTSKKAEFQSQPWGKLRINPVKTWGQQLEKLDPQILFSLHDAGNCFFHILAKVWGFPPFLVFWYNGILSIILKIGHTGLLYFCSSSGNRQPDAFLPDRKVENYTKKHKTSHYDLRDQTKNILYLLNENRMLS